MKKIITNIQKTIKEEKGLTIFVAYILFLPVFLFSLSILFELAKIQSLKNINEIITDISANAAVRQIDYRSNQENLQILNRDTTFTAPEVCTNMSIWGVNQTSTQLSRYKTQKETISSRLMLTKANSSTIPIERYNYLTAESVAMALYTINSENNGLNSEKNNTSTTSINIKVDNTMSGNYTDIVLGRTFYPSYPFIYFRSSISYRVNPILSFSSGNTIAQINIRSNSVSQLVSSTSGTR